MTQKANIKAANEALKQAEKLLRIAHSQSSDQITKMLANGRAPSDTATAAGIEERMQYVVQTMLLTSPWRGAIHSLHVEGTPQALADSLKQQPSLKGAEVLCEAYLQDCGAALKGTKVEHYMSYLHPLLNTVATKDDAIFTDPDKRPPTTMDSVLETLRRQQSAGQFDKLVAKAGRRHA